MNFKKIGKYIKCTALCIRFPFLYPRNRWTGLHYNSWKINEFLRTWQCKSYDQFFFKEVKRNENTHIKQFSRDDNNRVYYVGLYDGYVYITLDKKVTVFKKPCSYFGTGDILDVCVVDGQPALVVADNYKKSPDTCYIHNYTHAKWLANICNFLDWLERHPLQWIHCFTDYTELDAMEPGWRKAFGIKMCKEIKKALKKHHYLHQYRITQIKEKYGELRWYDASAPDEVFNIIQKYTQKSRRICLICGKPAKYISKGWISPYCGNCIGNRPRTRIRKYKLRKRK